MRANTYRAGARASLGALALLLWLAPSALAGPPSHPPSPELDLLGAAPDPGTLHPTQPFNHACGTAVDSKGDVYVASAGNNVIDVFNPAHEYLTSITGAPPNELGNEPCGLAVDSTGKLYVSEKGVGKVVRYTPNAYPFSGTPTYGPPTTIVSGNAKGISVDPTDDSLYVAEGTRVAIYKSDGTLLKNSEVQRLKYSGPPSGGSFTLTFKGQTTGPINVVPAEKPKAKEIEEALQALSSIGPGNVTVSGFSEPGITFVGALAETNVPQIVVDPSGLVGGSAKVETELEGFGGHLGEGELTNATGVASYTYQATTNSKKRRYISVADAASDEIEVFAGRFANPPGGFLPGTLEPPQTIDGSKTPAGELGLAPTGAYLGVDRRNGHLYAYDATNAVLNEFEASGRYFTRIVNPAFADAKPTAIAVDRSGGAHDGTVYVTAGDSSGAKLLAFGPVEAPSRASLGEPPAEKLDHACGTVVDSEGNLYLAGESTIKVYPPEPELNSSGEPIPLTKIEDTGRPCYLAVDSEGNLYAANGGGSNGGDEKVVLYKPQTYPPQSGTTYTEKTPPIETLDDPRGVAVNPSNDHLFVTHAGFNGGVIEYDSAANGSKLLTSQFCGLQSFNMAGVDVYGANGDVYVANGFIGNEITVCNPAGTKILALIDGSGSPGGAFTGLIGVSIAVDQSNGHVLVGEITDRGAVEEFEASGAFVAKFGSFQKVLVPSDIAVDNSGGPTNGNLYVAYREDLTAFGPLQYGEVPVAVTGTASAIDGEDATLNGTVDPNEFELTGCEFLYLTDEEYLENLEDEDPGFQGASSVSCAETLEEIGEGGDPVAVHAEITGLQLEGRYRFCLLATNKYGESECQPRLFGPPVITTKTAQPIFYREATLRAKLDPSGLQTKYHFEFLTDAQYLSNGETFAGAQSTPTETLSATNGPTDIEAFLTGRAVDTEYDFRLVAENEAANVPGPGQAFRTLSPPPVLSCPNETLRLENNSSRLPECRAYELVTPADTRGVRPRAEGPGSQTMFNNWLVTPSGPLAGESLAFFLITTLPDTEGSGSLDAFRATRDVDSDNDGIPDGWSSRLFSPSYVQKGDGVADTQLGVSPDQLYSFWSFGAATPPGAFPPGRYLRTPEGSPQPSPNCAVEVEPEGRFERIGCGSLGVDPEAQGKYISTGGSHVVFATESSSANTAVQLESGAPPSPLGAVYDRSPGGSTHVVSLLPGEITPTSSATYQGASPDGSAVVFAVSGSLYLRRDNTETVEVADAGSFSGISDDGKRVFYESGGGVHVFDAEGPSDTQIAANAKFIVVSADGSHVYYTSGGDLFAWDGGTPDLIAALDPEDLQGSGFKFPGTANSDQVALDSWTAQCLKPVGILGRAACPSRTTSDGKVLVFQSHADFTPPHEGQGHSEVYRYDASDASLLCVSCDPSGAPATAEADLQPFQASAPARATTLIPGVSEDGTEVFFQTAAALLPEDANSVLDVYEWLAQGTGGCARAAGCLALISSGQGDNPSHIYSMSADGHDVFFSTLEKLVGSDIPGSPSIYDARVEGGFPAPHETEPCHGDACQGEGAPPPSSSPVRSDIPNPGNGEQPKAKARCPKGRRAVKRNGKTRCVRPHHKKHRRAKAKGRHAR